MRTSLLLLTLACCALTACPPKDDDTEAPPPDDTDAGIEAETDCSDGADNDGDGLVDCEDDDCVDECMEDCTDEVDNDGDGLIDCDDDECVGDEACVDNEFTISMTNRLQGIALASGPEAGHKLGYPAASIFYGYIELVGYPSDPHGSGFACSGYAEAWPGAYYGYSLGSFYHAGYTPGAGDYVFEISLGSSHNLEWNGGCPVDRIPSFLLGMTHTVPEITRYDGTGSWYVQYSSTLEDMYSYGDHGLSMSWWYYPTQTNPVTWTGTYEL